MRSPGPHQPEQAGRVDPDALADDEMRDTQEDMWRWPRLRPALECCRDVLVRAYTESDTSAEILQERHRLFTSIAAVCGTAAVLVAIAQLTAISLAGDPPSWMMQLEALAAFAALVAVALGLRLAFHEGWLLRRHRAERLRLMKFRFLIHPDAWSRDAHVCGERRRQLEEEVSQLADLRRKSLHDWAAEQTPYEAPSETSVERMDPIVLGELVDYYLRRRLASQIDFFHRKAGEHFNADRFWRRVPPWLFFVSVVCALLHFALDIGERSLHHPGRPGHQIEGAAGEAAVPPPEAAEKKKEHPVGSILLIALAAGLPVAGAGIRTVRAAHESVRHTMRYHWNANVLRQIENRLRSAADPHELFRILWHSEELMEDEHREWLRLMLEAEWYG